MGQTENAWRLLKPAALRRGDRVAVVSTSWGAAGEADKRWRYERGVAQLRALFGLEAVPMPHTLAGEAYLAAHPEARAADLMTAFADPSIKGIIAAIGGNDSVRLLPYIDFDVIRRNPKVFIGYSDVMTVHLMCAKAGLSSFYGANLMTTLGDPQGCHSYTAAWLRRVLFEASPPGEIVPPGAVSCDGVAYDEAAPGRTYHPGGGYVCLQGRGVARGRLFGGHSDLMGLAGTGLLEPLDGAGLMLFIEGIVACDSPEGLAAFLRWLGDRGVLHRLRGLVFGRWDRHPEDMAYRAAVRQVIGVEYALPTLPVLWNLAFGHTSPISVMPYGALAEIDCDAAAFRLLESGVSQ